MASKGRKLGGKPCVMVPVDMFLELARIYAAEPIEGKKFFVEMRTIESIAYRKLQAAENCRGLGLDHRWSADWDNPAVTRCSKCGVVRDD